jgi:hypothetical protein
MKEPPYKGARCRTKGAGPHDEIFTVADVGTGAFNITKIRYAFAAHADWFYRETAAVTADLVDYVRRNNDPHEGYVGSMTMADLDGRFIISVEMTDAEANPAAVAEAQASGKRIVQLIDGNHAILLAARLGVTELPHLVVPKGIRHRFEVRHEVFWEGRWKTILPQEVLEMTRGSYARMEGDKILFEQAG